MLADIIVLVLYGLTSDISEIKNESRMGRNISALKTRKKFKYFS